MLCCAAVLERIAETLKRYGEVYAAYVYPPQAFSPLDIMSPPAVSVGVCEAMPLIPLSQPSNTLGVTAAFSFCPPYISQQQPPATCNSSAARTARVRPLTHM
jgi:hypothetical protein